MKGPIRTLPLGRWRRVGFVVTFESSGSVVVEPLIDGAPYGKVLVVPVALPTGEARVAVGAAFSSDDWTDTVVDFDDVVFAAE